MLPENINYHFVFGITGGIFSAIAFIPYVVAIIKKSSKPNRASWIIWNVTNVILLVSYFSVGARATIFLPIIYVFNAFIILILSFRYGASLWSRLDYISLFVAGFSLIIWFLTKNPLTALLMNLVMDAVAYLPTIKKSYLDPFSESRIAWLFIFLGTCLNLLAVNSFSFGVIIYPIVMFLMNGALLLVLFRKKIFKT